MQKIQNLQHDLDLAFNYLKREDLENAKKIYDELFLKHPNNFHINFYLGIIAFKKNQLNLAIKYLEQASKIDETKSEVFNNLGLIYGYLKNSVKAINNFNKAIKVNPKFSMAFCNLGIIQKNIGLLSEAKKNFFTSIKIDPQNFIAYYNLGNYFTSINDIQNSEKYFSKAIEINPKNINAYNNLFDVLDKSNQIKKLNELLTKAEKIFEKNKIVIFFQAKLKFQEKCYKEVIKTLTNLTFETEKNKEINRLELIAKSYDHLKNYDEAFKYFQFLNDKSFELFGKSYKKNNFLNLVKKRIFYFDKVNINIPDIKVKKSDEIPVFLIGFPRSGTTLLDTVLRTNKNISVIEEKPIVTEFINLLYNESEQTEPHIENINDDFVLKMRNKYFSIREKFLDKKNKVIIDKMPLNIIYLGEIIRFFPNAKFILAIRNPYDCVLSCFMQSFKINDAMSNFFSLKDSANCYDRVMNLWEIYKNKFSINYHQVKYEDLVYDFEKITKDLFKFLSVEWNEEVLNFYKFSKSRGYISTPSYNQINQPIYSQSVSRWKNYKNQILNVDKILSPWASKFEYNND